MCVFQPSLCPQCGFHSAHFEYDVRTGGYEIDCGRCGYSESYRPEYDADDGVFCGYAHIVRKGAGVLFFRYAGGHEFYLHVLNTAKEVLDSQPWLQQRLKTGTVDGDSAYLSRWDEDMQRVELVVGHRVELLAGRVVRRSGVPGSVERDNRGDRWFQNGRES